MVLTIARAAQTSWACPAQWAAWTTGDDYLYLRYQHGVGTGDRMNGSVTLTENAEAL